MVGSHICSNEWCCGIEIINLTYFNLKWIKRPERFQFILSLTLMNEGLFPAEINVFQYQSIKKYIKAIRETYLDTIFFEFKYTSVANPYRNLIANNPSIRKDVMRIKINKWTLLTSLSSV